MVAQSTVFQTKIVCFFNTGSFRKTDIAIRIARAFAASNVPKALHAVATRRNAADIMFTSWDTYLCQRLWYSSDPSPKSSWYSRHGSNSSPTRWSCHRWLQATWDRATIGPWYRSGPGIWGIEPGTRGRRASATGRWTRSRLVPTTSTTSTCLHRASGSPCTWPESRTQHT